MASSQTLIFLSLLLLLITSTHALTKVAPGPTPAPLNLTSILEKGSQYKTLLRLLKETQIGEQIESQLNNSFSGLTVFAPTDNAFSNLKAGTLNSLTSQDQVSLVLYHVLPRYYTPEMFQTTSNPVRTQATGNNGVYTLNVTSTTSQLNVSTGVDQTEVSNSLYTTFPLAVYSVDKVLLPEDLFGPKPPAAAPAPEEGADKPKDKTPSGKARAPSAAADASASGAGLRRVGWVGAVVGVVFVGSFL
ncbi:Fasciclin-like arabinogalactan protein 13 [Acorus calamus]|uniref:Fasciclin-like arabinogalactan protein 13 n=1 Tax=Acorus calamus TaxID=4465 RepID=A0AAV9FHM0_ACOCL|nr:Fasciclin-like arabinogalactan protein 13 [Acorus calamus]